MRREAIIVAALGASSLFAAAPSASAAGWSCEASAARAAVLNTPILEEFSTPDEYKGIDILRTIRSFDPCMPCTTHVYAGQQTIVREINTCACILEEEVPAGVG